MTEDPGLVGGVSTHLAESEERYRRLLASVTDYVYTVTVEDGRPVATVHGPGCVAVTGYTPEAYALDPFLWHRMVHDDDKAAVTAQAEAVLASGAAPPLEHRIVHRGGSVRWVRNTPVPRFDEHGRLVGYDGLISDITSRKQAELALRESEEKYRSLVEASTDAIFLESLEGLVLDCNPAACRMFGYSKEELVGLAVADLVPDEVRPQLVGLADALRSTGGAFLESFNVRRGGEVFPCEVSTQVVSVGGEARVIAFVRDLTEPRRRDREIVSLAAELQRRNAELELANSELEAFACMVSHDLRSPLVVVDGFLRVLLEEPVTELPAEVVRSLRHMQQASQRMQDLIDALLDFSRLAMQPLRRRSVDIAVLARQVWEELVPAEPGRELRLEVREVPACEAGPLLMRQVLVNLLSNALKFTRTKPVGVIEVGGVERTAERVYFVRDNGIGFEPASARGLFDLFRQLERAQGLEGSGVGLAIVRRIVERHGGRVWAESRPGEGATFFFAIPE
ncbi:MAG: PAS domain S-box protein [Thermoanaerobaculaceae bacterium]|nr:PAS domain S-box protein [Thermoanaerobaculaceae bacterium]MDI9621097.1 PAS domain S-box protein [Acidobacteriota bacterium]NLH09917.1 PAS domain S-box protein [Holophagae bacterium]HPW55532.1 PAS domain S-box protein [Thermoanaerobaculaceae bacterium]